MEKKKKVFIFLVVILFIFCNFLAIVYADENKGKIDFFSANKTEVTIGETVELKIDLDKISFDNFNFVLSTDVANININDIYTDNNNLDTEINDDNELSITVDKTKTNVNQIKLFYKIPEDVKIGDQINLTAEISRINVEENTENEINNEIVVNQVLNEVINNNESNQEENQINQIVLTIVEEGNNDDNEELGNKDENKDETMNNQQEDFNNEPNSNKENNSQKIENANLSNNEVNQYSNKTSIVSNMSVTSQNSKSSETVVTYNGSQNNYLENLIVDGYELNNSFTKENSTYFVSVDEDTTSIDVSAEAEEDLATVCIYGNDNLKEGINKVLISVTSESGEVRNYRIYVEK